MSILGPALYFSTPQAALDFALERTGAISAALYAGTPPASALLAKSPESWIAPEPASDELRRAFEEAQRADDYLTAVQTVAELRCYPLLVPVGDGWDVIGLLALAYETPPAPIEHEVRDALSRLLQGHGAQRSVPSR